MDDSTGKDPARAHTRARGAPPSATHNTSTTQPTASTETTGAGAPDNGRTGLLIDWGGVLTTNLFTSFHEYCIRMEIDPAELGKRFSADPQFRELLISLEKGAIEEGEFEESFAELLGVESDGLIDGLFAGVQPDTAMVDAVRTARKAGIRTALVSNSWGVHRYPHDLFDELFDGVVISGVEKTRKPAKRMYELGAERAGLAAELCVFVDDLPFNLTPAQELGMATVHHTSAETTIPELEALLGVALGQ
ncbi:MAG: HAD family phosphatase [Solirubrobacteraceae bacterium]